MMKRQNNATHVLATIVGALALGLAAYLSFSTGSEKYYSPLPALVVIPALLLPVPHLALLVPPALFLIWNPQMFRGESTVPVRTPIAFAVLIALSILYFVSSWHYGLEYQGAAHTKFVCIGNVVLVALLAVLWAVAHKVKQYSTSFAFNWCLVAWLTWYAFPYLGELP